MVSITKAIETDKWLPAEWRKCTFPMLRQPAKTCNDIMGSAFVLSHERKSYIITAAHVIESGNISMGFTKKDTEKINISLSEYQQGRFKWVKHPANLDITAIPFEHCLQKELDLFYVNSGCIQNNLKLKDWVAHLGYPLKGTSNYLNKSQCFIPQGMPGPIIEFKRVEGKFIMHTASAPGASGGPVFLRGEDKKAHLIGVVTEARMTGNHLHNNHGAQYLEITTALFASLIKDILESDEMKKQI